MSKLGFILKFRGKVLYGSFSHQGKKFLHSTGIVVENQKYFNFKDRSFCDKHVGWKTDTLAIQKYEESIRTWIYEARLNGLNQVDYVKTKQKESEIIAANSLLSIQNTSGLYSSVYSYIVQNPLYKSALETKNKNKLNDFISVLKLIRDYQIGKSKKLLINDLNNDLLKDMFNFHLSEHKQHLGNYESEICFDKFIIVEGKSETTLSDIWGTFKKIILYFEHDLRLSISSSVMDFKMTRGIQKTPVTVQFDEFEKILNYIPEDEDEEKVKDFALVSLGSGLNFYDFHKLTEKHFVKCNGYYRIEFRRNKTSSKCEVPLTDVVYDIFKKYNFKMDCFEGYQFNKAFRKVMSKMDCFDIIDEKYAEENGLKKPLTRKEILSHENFRKTYITYCFDLGIEESKIRKRVGHQDGRQMKHYNDNSERYINPEIKNLMTKIIKVF